ncbi:unnamed protein product, partial [Polarella glacialis]
LGDPAVVAPRAPAAALADRASKQAPDDREEFTGLRIRERTHAKEVWAAEVRGPGRCVVPFNRVMDKCISYRRQQQARDRDTLIIGVLYQLSPKEKLANGEQYLRWCLTDLAQPKPRQVVVHVRFAAYSHWRAGEPAASARKGAILAVLNPAFVEGGEGSGKTNTDPVLRVERAKQIVKLGECPSLGACQIKACPNPCNLEDRQRFCEMHLSMVYADKKLRTAAGGGADSGTAALLRMSQKRSTSKLAREYRNAGEVENEIDNEEEAGRVRREMDNKRNRTAVAVRLDDRRFDTTDSKEDYFRCIRTGNRPD